MLKNHTFCLTYQWLFARASPGCAAMVGNPMESVTILAKREFCKICRALNYIHSVISVCHRDFKPQNILSIQ
ncbi:hypothetical protein L1987_54474 [Smallanthus sonchifolius]|uniref:Uncharacterized protein n=1 Tax=Smallanthus sonchifolius TaxID=185202 RepID=A0ACB9E7I9_9ASTR|nr:hypothetical protein L1987_54474 [Smallanthus sonchifolius]